MGQSWKTYTLKSFSERAQTIQDGHYCYNIRVPIYMNSTKRYSLANSCGHLSECNIRVDDHNYCFSLSHEASLFEIWAPFLKVQAAKMSSNRLITRDEKQTQDNQKRVSRLDARSFTKAKAHFFLTSSSCWRTIQLLLKAFCTKPLILLSSPLKAQKK